MKGVPIRIEVGPKDIEKEQVVVVTRNPKEKMFVPEADLLDKVTEIAQNYTQILRDQHLQKFETFVENAETIIEAKTVIENSKIACVGICSIEMDGYDCAEQIEKGTGGQVRGKRVDDEPIKFERCIVCGKKSCRFYSSSSSSSENDAKIDFISWLTSIARVASSLRISGSSVSFSSRNNVFCICCNADM